ncbi:caspase-3-like [Acanthaster planci]|uniref:Caspase-3-like n=1 Tax=Acanthaster planci TaxID=133434 RepID=A0A8B7XX33_ACAPL|nr:caspase-3-like [Acanthaster planci]XP_022084368.1 caspase-3-like [Acanthaster planci]XP_022084370.1 caspase-3-like [Acanthaster planci]XP_022084371.1 caspase-3-like [Acanthaster planci]XP_022084372.1 caspase-3-like [Acanthaster planci]XP_022084373.1 caspase-3-like [Acanthaster planci]
MSARRKTPTAHMTLLIELDKCILKEQFGMIKQMVKAEEFGNLKPGELEKIKTPDQLFQKLEHKNIIKVGDYRKLRHLFERKLEFHHLIAPINVAEDALEGEGHPVMREPASSEETALLPPSSNNKTRQRTARSLGDAIPTEFPVDDRPQYPDGRGYVLFINEFVGQGHGNYRRKGGNVDEENIKKLFSISQNYHLDKYEDLTKPELVKVLEDTKEKLKKGNYAKFILIICSHGRRVVQDKNNPNLPQDCIVTVDHGLVTEEELTEPFFGDKFKEFAGKPKVFIIQACRKPADSPDDMMEDQSRRSLADSELGPSRHTRPKNADVLISYATTKGTKAWRNEEKGSWFIHHFCKVVQKWHETEYLTDLLLRVNDKISRMEFTEEQSDAPAGESDPIKQMPCQICTLTKHVKL